MNKGKKKEESSDEWSSEVSCPQSFFAQGEMAQVLRGQDLSTTEIVCASGRAVLEASLACGRGEEKEEDAAEGVPETRPTRKRPRDDADEFEEIDDALEAGDVIEKGVLRRPKRRPKRATRKNPASSKGAAKKKQDGVLSLPSPETQGVASRGSARRKLLSQDLAKGC